MKLALLSVSDKRGIVELGRSLSRAGYTILSTGGTKSALDAAGVPATQVSDYTGSPEMMEGRVKTLHPRIHGGILGLRDHHAADAQANGIEWIDVVVVNLYPFEATVARGADYATAIENIDIGGPSMVRSAAKNHRYVYVVVDPDDYHAVAAAVAAEEGSDLDDLGLRQRLAAKAFRHTARYDAVISGWLDKEIEGEPFPAENALPLRRVQTLRYGENPHQKAAFYADGVATGRSLARAVQKQGKELSFNNLADADAALRAVFDIEGPACVIVKHMNPCGAATAPTIAEAYGRALAGDPVSAYGGICVFNRPLSADDVGLIKASKVFFEVIAAPGLSDGALAGLSTRENLRVLQLPDDWAEGRPPGCDGRRVQGGWLLQDWDLGAPFEWKIVTSRHPGEDETRALEFAWSVCRNVKSNAIVLARSFVDGEAINGVGAGQMSRVDSVRIAISKATSPVAGCVLASDAFFPFADGVQMAVEAGVSAIIQPGGSIRDKEVIEVAESHGVAMVFTGTRHFRH
jgi:phosphoribosylaminoimidazolecarboxamide formyltransferase/IMP cyclohydrolase